MKTRIENSHIPPWAFKMSRFEDYEAKTEVQKRALEAAKVFCGGFLHPEEMDDEQLDKAWDGHTWSILFHGSCGTGKTHLAIAIGLEYLKHEQIVIFWNVTELLNELRQGYKENSYYSLLETVKRCELLILDDWGMHKSSDWADEQLDSLIEYRSRNGMDTVLTTNLSFNELQPRVRSRVSEGITVLLDGPDYRALIGLGKVKKKARGG